MKSYTIHCISTARSPLTHMSGTVGNEAVIAVERVLTDRGERFVPILSGNALRHRAIREPGMLWLIDELGLRGNLSLPQLNFLLHGGNLTESNARENTALIARMKETWPLLRLLGGSLKNQILAGSLDVWRGSLVCEENRHSLSLVDLPEKRLRSAESFVGEYQYTRGDAAKLGEPTTDGHVEDRDSNLMIFAGQCVLKGAIFHHGFVLKHVSELELGALLWSLRLWQDSGGTIGGQAARGHGRLQCNVLAIDGVDQSALCDQYVEFVRDNREGACEWLLDAWGDSSQKKPAKKKAAKK